MTAIAIDHDNWSSWVPTVERRIIGVAIDLIIAQGNAITVWDGEDNAIQTSMHPPDIIECVAATDITVFTIFDEDCNILGWIAFIHGNREDVLSDASVGKYTDDLIEAIEKEVNDV